MAGFYGSYPYTVDAKGRMNVPAKFRKTIVPDADGAFTVVITRGPEECLRIYPEDVWEAKNAELYSGPETPEVLEVKRRQNAGSCYCKLDVQGRVSFMPRQMAISGIEKEGKVIIVGMGEYIEVWDAARYERYEESRGDFSELYYKVQAGMAK